MADTELTRNLLLDGFGRIAEGVPAVVDGLSVDELLWRPDPDANHIAWLIWHLSRQQDEQLAQIGGAEAVWRVGAWADRFALPYEANAHGYGMTSEQVGAFTLTDPAVLTEYFADVHAETVRIVTGLSAQDHARVIDPHWDPPVTVAVRIVSVLDDSAKHLGQAEYLRGIVTRRR